MSKEIGKLTLFRGNETLLLNSSYWKNYLWTTIFIAVLTMILRPFGITFDIVNIALIYLFPVLISAVYWGIGCFYAAGVSVLAFDYFFVPPYFSLTVDDLRYLVTCAVYLTVASLTSSLAARLRNQLHLAKQREATASSLYALSRQMTAITNLNSLLANVSRQVSETIHTPVAIYLPDNQDKLELSTYTSNDTSWGQGEAEMVIAKWVYQHGAMAGRGSQTLRESSGLYIPLRTEDRIYGVLAVNLENRKATPETQLLLEAFGGLAASAIARVKLGEEAKIAHLTVESERIRTALLDSVSHELRTPLATIIGSATGLIEGDQIFSSKIGLIYLRPFGTAL